MARNNYQNQILKELDVDQAKRRFKPKKVEKKPSLKAPREDRKKWSFFKGIGGKVKKALGFRGKRG
jgi:hypothetical protein